MAMQARGDTGVLLYGYHVVARLSSWHLTDTEQVLASFSEIHEFYRQQEGPFTLRLKLAKAEWEWRFVQVLAWEPAGAVLVSGKPTVRV